MNNARTTTIPDLKIILQSHSNKINMALTQKQTCKPWNKIKD